MFQKSYTAMSLKLDLPKNLTLEYIYNSILSEYQDVLNKTGLWGLFGHRNIIAKEIYTVDNILRLNNLNHRQLRMIDESDYLQNLTAIKVFRDVALKVKLNIEIYTYLKVLIGFMSNIGMIPFIVLSVYLFFKRLLTIFSLGFTSTLFLMRFSNESQAYNSIFNNLICMKEVIRVFCLKSYNIIFSENLPLYSTKNVVSGPTGSVLDASITNSSAYGTGTSYYTQLFNYVYDSISVPAHAVGLGSLPGIEEHPYIYASLAALFTVGTLSIIYVYPNAVPDAGGYIWTKTKYAFGYIISYYITPGPDGGDGPDPDGGDGPGPALREPGFLAIPNPNNRIVRGDAPEVVDLEPIIIEDLRGQPPLPIPHHDAPLQAGGVNAVQQEGSINQSSNTRNTGTGSYDDKFLWISIKKYQLVACTGKDKKGNWGRKLVFRLTIYDSYLILPSALNDLAHSFNLPLKLEFKHDESNTADLSDIKFRQKLLQYNKHDCFLLYEIIRLFNESMFELFEVEIWNSPTLTALAYKIFKQRFLKNSHKISITKDEDYVYYVKAYFGGAVDVYRPLGKDLFYYDANSLYPSVMSNKEYPIGEPWYFQIETDKGGHRPLSEVFGIVRAKVTCPDHIFAPILLTRSLDDAVIAPTGTWTDWYCSEELKNAVKYGYQVEVLEGYNWDKSATVFKGYVDTIYKYRRSFAKTDCRNLICKLLLNSLYGRFGMAPVLNNSVIAPTDPIARMNFLSKEDYQDVQEIGGITIVSSSKFVNNRESKPWQLLEISTPLAVFTTAYARILMSEYKMKYSNNLYYSDTDSLVLDCELPSDKVGNDLGQFKLEHKVSEGVFSLRTSPKVYALRLSDGKEIIKVKGLRQDSQDSQNKVSLDSLKELLHNNKNLSNQTKVDNNKWIRNLDLGQIHTKDNLYSITLNENKRELVMDSNNNIIGTKPFSLP